MIARPDPTTWVRVALEPPNIALIGISAKLVDGVGDALSGRLVEAL